MTTHKYDVERCGGVGITADALWQWETNAVVEKLNRAEVLNCELDRGSGEQRPWGSGVMGAVLVSPAFFIAEQLVALQRGENRLVSLRLEAAFLVLSIVGRGC